MKKLISLTVLSLALFIGSASAFAQNSKDINSIAAEKAAILQKSLKLNDTTQEELYKAFKVYGNDIARLKNTKTADSQDLEKVESKLEMKLKSILSEENYLIYKDMLKSNM